MAQFLGREGVRVMVVGAFAIGISLTIIVKTIRNYFANRRELSADSEHARVGSC